MGIIADDEAPPEIPAEAFEKAGQMREILYADAEESAIAKMVRAFEGGSIELQLFTWQLLTKLERRAWHLYYSMRERNDF